jgi:hypothetical protein
MALLLGFLLAGCTQQTTGSASPVSTITSHVTVTSPAGPAAKVPPILPPAKSVSACPYVSNDEVSDDNGQRVASVKVSSGSDGQPHPVCYFYRPDGGWQMTVRIYVGTPAVAIAMVDQAAPVATSNPAVQPPGWNGGSASLGSKGTVRAVYAVAKGGTAIVVTTNQLQTIKCRLVTIAVVAGLHL